MAASKPRSLVIQAHLSSVPANPNDAAAVNFSNLPGDAAGSASGGGDDNRLAFLGRGDFHAEECGEAVHAEHTEEDSVRNEWNLGDFLEELFRRCVDDNVVLQVC